MALFLYVSNSLLCWKTDLNTVSNVSATFTILLTVLKYKDEENEKKNLYVNKH